MPLELRSGSLHLTPHAFILPTLGTQLLVILVLISYLSSVIILGTGHDRLWERREVEPIVSRGWLTRELEEEWRTFPTCGLFPFQLLLHLGSIIVQPLALESLHKSLVYNALNLAISLGSPSPVPLRTERSGCKWCKVGDETGPLESLAMVGHPSYPCCRWTLEPLESLITSKIYCECKTQRQETS